MICINNSKLSFWERIVEYPKRPNATRWTILIVILTFLMPWKTIDIYENEWPSLIESELCINIFF
jgi:hypothetical protein